MLINQIEPINESTTNFLEEEAKNTIDEIVELPLRKACKIFKEKGIETIMSSANKNNILKPGEIPLEKEDLYGGIEKIFETHTFLEAGRGYAWIMLNFNTLSDENKDLLFDLEKQKGKNDEKLGEKLIWIVHPAEMTGNIEFSLRIGKYDYDYLRLLLCEDEIPKNIEAEERLIVFEERHIVLLYPWDTSSTEAIFLRMPINEQTTVEEVEQYFVNLAKCFKNQIYKKQKSVIKR